MSNYVFKKEKYTMAVILVSFGLSYLTRFLWDHFFDLKLYSLDS